MVRAAASLELLHPCALVHDDVMDESDIRRGRPSAHTSFVGLHAERSFTGDGASFGRAAAIVLGDLLLCWSDRMLTAAPFDPFVARGVRRVYDDMREQVITGQYLDVLVQARGGYSADDALLVAEYKTGKYTVEGPLLMGAAAGNASSALTAALRAYARPLGEAFQLRDDVLGVFGDPRRTGKPAGDDLREGKRTLLVAIAMQRADPAQAAVLRRHLGDRRLNDAGRAALGHVIVDTGALAEVEARILAGTAQAQAALAVPAMPADVRVALDQIAVAVTRRQT
jgi:geranylgeranyl diphosphate synthase type I